MNSEGVFWSNFGRLVRVVDIFINKRYMRYSFITLFVVIASFRGAEDRGRPFLSFCDILKTHPVLYCIMTFSTVQWYSMYCTVYSSAVLLYSTQYSLYCAQQHLYSCTVYTILNWCQVREGDSCPESALYPPPLLKQDWAPPKATLSTTTQLPSVSAFFPKLPRRSRGNGGEVVRKRGASMKICIVKY